MWDKDFLVKTPFNPVYKWYSEDQVIKLKMVLTQSGEIRTPSAMLDGTILSTPFFTEL